MRVARHHRRDVEVDITSMIDVVLLLVFFFMTTAQFARQNRAELELPRQKGEQKDAPEEAGLVINITKEGALVVGSRPVDDEELRLIVRDEIRRAPDRPAAQLKLLIRADRNAPAAHLNRVATLLESFGVGTARLATEVPR